MPGNKLFLNCKKTPLSVSSSSKRHVDKRATCTRTVRKKTSVEDLAEQGYFIGQEIGTGTYCKVKEAAFNGEKMAVKIITRSKISLNCHSKFLPREIEILSKVRHKHIVHVYKIFSYPKQVFIFMELVERGDLLNLIRDRGRLTEAKARRYFKQMLNGMQYLHSLNIAHRDLKCENIMINDEDEVKIIDFGFSRTTVNKEGRRELCETYCGTRAYTPPEVLQNIPYNPMLYDVWSMGCLLFIMVTGKAPFDDTNRRMIENQLRRNFLYPDTFSISKEIKTVLSRMLEPDVLFRATLKQVSELSWIKDGNGSFLSEERFSKKLQYHYIAK